MKLERTSLLAAGSLLSALLSFLPLACCIAPVAFAFLGVGTLTFATSVMPYRPYFVALAFVFLALGFYLSYRPQKVACADGEACSKPTSKKITRIILWIATLLTLALAASPYVIPYLSI